MNLISPTGQPNIQQVKFRHQHFKSELKFEIVKKNCCQKALCNVKCKTLIVSNFRHKGSKVAMIENTNLIEEIHPTEKANPVVSYFMMTFTMLAGVVLPAVTIGVEVATNMCANELFDPVPTVWHVLLVAFVPLVNLQVWLAVRRARTQRGTLLGWANALAIGIALFYAVVFITVTPIAIIAIAFGGLGLLPLAPMLSLIAALLLRAKLRQIVPPARSIKWSGLAIGVVIGLMLLVLIEIPSTLTRIGMEMATSEQTERRTRGMKLLRVAGSEEYILRACYERRNSATDPLGFLFTFNDPTTAEEARAAYYRLTGQSFDSVPPPRLAGRWNPMAERDFDTEQGGEIVAGKLRGLSLKDSRLDGSVDANANVGYLEWTMIFKNDSNVQREARAQVQLPHGAVISRLTLWVNGEEREAAFAGRGRVRAAYEGVVRQRRDPVLVTTTGADRVLVQCFPVPPNNGEMKIRIGITAPLTLENHEQAALRLPHIVERNFDVGETAKHSIWMEAKNSLIASSDNLRGEQPRSDLYAVRGEISDAELMEPTATIHAVRNGEVKESWTRLSGEMNSDVVRQFIAEENLPAYKNVVLVIDASRRMKPHLDAIINSIARLPEDVNLQLVLAVDEGKLVPTLKDNERLTDVKESRRSIVEAVRNAKFEGGADNVAALVQAWDYAAQQPQSILVWVHAAQPVLLSSPDDLRRRWERRPTDAPLISVATENKANRILEKLDGIQAVQSRARFSDLQIDLENLFAELNGGEKKLRLVRERVNFGEANANQQTKQTSKHLARLWANDEVKRLLATGDERANEAAMKLAVEFQLVTPVSGAVVLENKEQYERAGLQSVEAGSVPTIPEPETVLLLVVVAAMLMWTYRHKLFARVRI